MSYNSKPKHPVNYVKALHILSKLLAGELPKNISIDEGIPLRTVYSVKEMFPLFFNKQHSDRYPPTGDSK